nr:unnamed protein product [Callosobruchus analis]
MAGYVMELIEARIPAPHIIHVVVPKPYHSSCSISNSRPNMIEKTLQEFADEIRKLKAMIVKHENRIRALEAEAALNKAQQQHVTSAAAQDEDGAGGGDGLNAQPQQMAADEAHQELLVLQLLLHYV